MPRGGGADFIPPPAGNAVFGVVPRRNSAAVLMAERPRGRLNPAKGRDYGPGQFFILHGQINSGRIVVWQAEIV